MTGISLGSRLELPGWLEGSEFFNKGKHHFIREEEFILTIIQVYFAQYSFLWCTYGIRIGTDIDI